MPADHANPVIRHVRRAMLGDGADLSDGQLLGWFIEQRDEDAFAALVKRHGPMVWGVCRRILSGHQDAEDTFQATFLVLFRKAASVVPREMLGNWLYGVAFQTAVRARSMNAKRRARERQVEEMPEPAAVEQGIWSDLKPLLDQELLRLPDKYRFPVVLCDLEGKTYQEAARQLGCPAGTFAARLSRARAMLARRLARHGLIVSGGALSAVLSAQAASACVPPLVLSSTLKAAGFFAAGRSVAVGVISARVALLTEGVLKTMLLTNLKMAAMAVLAVSMIGLGTTALTYRTLASDQDRAPHAATKAAKDREKDTKDAQKPKAEPRQAPRRTALGLSLAQLKKTYGLADEEILKCVRPPFSEARQVCFHAYAGDGPNRTGFMIFHWGKDNLKVNGATVGFPASGYGLPGLLTAVAGIYPQEIEGDKELLENRIAADFIVREGVPVEKLVTRLETILQKECDLPVRFSLQEVERKVFVARGKYKFTPVPGSDGRQVEIFAKELRDPKSGGGGTGDFSEFINWVGRFVNRRIVLDKVENAPRTLSWHDNFRSPFTKAEREEDHDPEAVLQNVSAQTSLTFREESRRVRILHVERVK